MKTAALLPMIAILAVSAGLSSASAESLVPHTAEYKVKISVLSGRMETRLARTDAGYKATHRIEPTGLANAFVDGEIFAEAEFSDGDGGIVPIRYVANDEISKDKLRADVRFDWHNDRAVGTYQTRDEAGPVDVNAPLDAIVYDGVSIQYELMRDLMTSGAAENYMLFDVDELKKLNVSRVGEKTVKTPAGEFDVVGIRHQAENSSRQTTLWCAESLNYLPVLIERHRKGKLQMRARLVEYRPETVSSPLNESRASAAPANDGE